MPSYLPFPISHFDISCAILVTKIENCAANELAKKNSDYYFEGLYKSTYYKTKSIFLSFSFLIDCCVSVFFFPYQSIGRLSKN